MAVTIDNHGITASCEFAGIKPRNLNPFQPQLISMPLFVAGRSPCLTCRSKQRRAHYRRRLSLLKDFYKSAVGFLFEGVCDDRPRLLMQIDRLQKRAFESLQPEGYASVVDRIGERHADEALPDRLGEGLVDGVERELSDGLSRHLLHFLCARLGTAECFVRTVALAGALG
jgi:hypothetical protein